MTPELFTEVGFRLNLAILLVVVLVLGALTWWLVRRFKRADTDADVAECFAAGAIFSAVLTVTILVVLLVVAFPWRPAYWKVYRVETTVLSVSNVISEASGDLTRTPVLEIEGVDRPVVMEDPRAVSLEGKDVTLTCRISWNYQAADTYSCDIYAIGGAS